MRKAFAILSLFCIFTTGFSSCNSNSQNVRLIWGAGDWEGNVQVCLDGNWGFVCQNGFDAVVAQVVCNQLGYNTMGALARTGSVYGSSANLIKIDNVNCTGSESSMLNCSYTTVLPSNCNPFTLAGVICQSGGNCTTNDIRLISTGITKSQGRVEVCKNSQWGTVCDYGWSSTDVGVACRQLGFIYGGNAYSNAYFGQGYGPIHMSYVSCSSYNSRLTSCSHNSGNSYGCTHSDDAGVRCYGQVTSSCTSGQVKLWRPYDSGPSNEGVVLYCRNNFWRGACNYGLSCHTLRVICKELGYAGLIAQRTYRSYGYYNYYDSYRIDCDYNDNSLSQCTRSRPGRYYWQSYYGYRFQSYCNSIQRIAAAVCYAPMQGNACTNGTVRLVNGSSADEGRVEYCYEGEWVPFCGLSASTASIICNHFGYNNSYASIFDDERFGRSTVLSSFNHIYCSSNHIPLSQCVDVRKGSSCYISVSQCTTEYGLRCYNPGACSDDGQIRLVNGTIEQEGRVEICLNGVWGGICDVGWSTNDAYVFCRGIGYNGQGPNTYYDAFFGETTGPIIWSNLACHGWETSISNCAKLSLPNFNCTHQNSAGVTCKDACTNGDVKLIGGKYSNEGTVVVCYSNLWGLIKDNGWSNGDAEVVCNNLGYSGGIAEPISGSRYGKPNLIIHFSDVSCFGHEANIIQCSKTTLSFSNGKQALASASVAGVDCLYDEPTDCIIIPDWISVPGSECSFNGMIRLQGSDEEGTGRLEYCYNGYWSPFCKLSHQTAYVACKELGYTSYSIASVMPTDKFGIVRNFSLFDNITCTGSESSISECDVLTAAECTPWCASNNMAITCFNPGMCTNGEIRLVDGYIENEGRIEVCYNGVWGVICDNGWDATDAHVVCVQMGYPELEPVVFTNSSFGAGQYPIVYSNFACGGWEDSLADCSKIVNPHFNCSRKNVAGILCGYDCNDGDVRLVGSEWSYEGTIEICYGNVWGLINDSSWNQPAAEVVCRQLGYQTHGTIPYYGSHFSKPNKTIHLSSVFCTGSEDMLNECTLSSLSLQMGKEAIAETDVAGVKCYTPDQCVPPPLQGTACINGNIRLTGGQPFVAEGNLEYCYHGSWSLFCYLGHNEAIVACRQLGYTQYDIIAIFNDGRFGYYSFSSFFQNFTCENNPGATSLSNCDIIDSCQTDCDYPVGLHCYESLYCQEGAVRLVNGTSSEAGRLEVCSNGIWGSVCGKGFDVTDAYVVCRELGLGISEPIVYTNSYFGDGNEAIIYSNLECGGYEGTISDCPKQSYGSFSCSRNNVAGLICSDDCLESDLRLVFGRDPYEGTIEVCHYNTWGLISDVGWSDNEAEVICRQMNYSTTYAVGLVESYYGKPNRNVQLVDVVCNGTEERLEFCESTLLTPEEVARFHRSNVAGVNCMPRNEINITTTTPLPSGDLTPCEVQPCNCYCPCTPIIMITLIVLLLVSVIIIISCCICVLLKHYQLKKRSKNRLTVNMQSLNENENENPLSIIGEEDDLQNELYDVINSSDKNKLVLK